MVMRAKKIWNVEDIHYFAEDVLNRYYLNIGEENVSEIVKKYIYKLGETCAGIFSEDEVWSVIKILQENDCIADDVLEKSSIQKFTKTSNPAMNEQVKEELIDLASNKVIRHINKGQSDIKEYKTKCLTIDSKKDTLKVGELVSTLEYSQDGFDLKQTLGKNEEGVIDFTQNNIFIKIKEDSSNGEKNKHVRIIVAKQMEKSS